MSWYIGVIERGTRGYKRGVVGISWFIRDIKEGGYGVWVLHCMGVATSAPGQPWTCAGPRLSWCTRGGGPVSPN